MTQRMKRLFRFLLGHREGNVPADLIPSMWKAKIAGLIRFDDEGCVWPTRKGIKAFKRIAREGA